MSTVNLYTDYFRSNIVKAVDKLNDGTIGSYEQYNTTSHESDMTINGHRLRMRYVLRMDIATQELVALPVPTAKVTVTYSAYEASNTDSLIQPSANKEAVFNLIITASTIHDQIDEAIELFRLVIEQTPIPAIDFDFWQQVAKSMKLFDKVIASTDRDNSDKITLVK
jgi:hypothetical protein